MRVLKLNDLLPKLRELFNSLSYVEVAIVFGSLAVNGYSYRDIDVAILLEKPNLLHIGEVVEKLAEALSLSEDNVDILLLNDANPFIIYKVLNEGIIVKSSDKALSILMKRIRDVNDQLIVIREWSNLDPDPKIDKVIITSRIEEIRRNTEFIHSEILIKRVEELKYGEILALERALHRMIEAMLDICRHLVSVYSLGIVESYGQYPRKLVQIGKMPKELGENVAKLAGLRNILVHRYVDIDVAKLYSVAKEVVERIAREFIKWIKDLDP